VRYVVFLKQVPAASELPWDPKTGQLRREAAPGMMDPAARAALEAALRLQEAHGGQVLAVTMGPPQAEEVLRQALALGADRGFLLSDRRLAGADTVATSYTLARALGAVCPDFDLLLLGSRSADSETGQVGPHLAEELGIPAAAYVEELELAGRTLAARRLSDGFLESLELDLPALVTVAPRGFAARPVPLTGVEAAFGGGEVFVLDAGELRADLAHVGLAGSAGVIRRVYPASARESGVLIQGTAKAAVEELLRRYGRRLGGLAGRDLGGEQG
jgi:electron transfer flavoprotein beta subunit